ncbi:MAG: Uma2 family endonuclease [Chloroflexi bacterium]|nr:Uma2 family endonuclease [Chloroflexota bacterium]
MGVTQYRITVADLELMPADGNRYEVIDGELYVTHAPHADHQDVIEQIKAGLRAWDPERTHGWVLEGAGVIFSVDDGVIPDLVWVSTARYAEVLVDPKTGTRDGRLHAAPDLVVEVLSAGAAHEDRDRRIKLALYSRRGVKEYWIADRATRRVEAFRRDENAVLVLVATLTDADRLTSPLLPDFTLLAAHIFRLPPGLPA